MRKSSKPAKVYDVKFYVTWNRDRGLFDIKRDGVPAGRFAHDKITAIGMAIADAQRVSAHGDTSCVVAYSPDGNRVVEWESDERGGSSPEEDSSVDRS